MLDVMFYNNRQREVGNMMDYSYHHQYNMYPEYYTPQYSQQYPPYPMPNFLNPINSGGGGGGGGTGTTPTLTPTSLANLEQTFIELQSVPHANGVGVGGGGGCGGGGGGGGVMLGGVGPAGNTTHGVGGMEPLTQSGFVPPVVDPSSREQSQDSFESDPEWEPALKRGRGYNGGGDGGGMLVMDAGGQSSSSSGGGTPQRKYTRRSRNEKLSPEEEERRSVRRERNKLAAAKCRQRRVDHTNSLVEETEKLEAVKSDLENEIQALQQQKDQLEFLLQAHVPLCKVDPLAATIKVKAEPADGSGAPHHLLTSMAGGCMGGGQQQQQQHMSGLTSRPTSLPLVNRSGGGVGEMAGAGVSCAQPVGGVPLTSTPSSGLFSYAGLDSLVDGGSSGLTPLTSGGPGVSCSSQLHRSESESGSDNVSSPTLISL